MTLEESGRAHDNDDQGSAKKDDQGQNSGKDDQGSADDDLGSQSKADPDKQRAIDDMIKWKLKAREATDKVEKLEGDFNLFKRESLESKEDYKSLYETEKETRAGLEAKLVKHSSYVSRSEKLRAVLPKFMEQSAHPDAINDWLDNHDLDELQLETTSTGRFFVDGVDTFVDKVKRDKPWLFNSSKAPNVNSGTGSGNPSKDPQKIDAQYVVAMQRKHGTQSNEYISAYKQYRKNKETN